MTSPRQESSPSRQELRGRMLKLIVSIAVVHGVAITAYYALHVPERPMKTQQTFIAVWVVVTLGVLVPQMKGIRALRRPRR